MSRVGEKNESQRQLIKVFSKEISQEDQLISGRLRSPILGT